MILLLAKKRILLLAAMLTIAPRLACAQNEKRSPQNPSFSPDAKQLVYLEDVTKGGEILSSSSEIWIAKDNGTPERRLTTGSKDADPRFSPDGQKIVFARDGDIWLIGSDGAGLTNITQTPDATEQKPEFTQDGRAVLFIRRQSGKVDAKLLADDPIAAALGMPITQTLVWRGLDDGKERTVVEDGYDVELIAPHPGDDLVYILCKQFGDGKKPAPLTFEKCIASVKLDGSALRTVYTPAPGSRREIRGLRSAAHRLVISVNDVDADFHSELKVYALDDESAEWKLLPDLIKADDVSRDGNLIATIGLTGLNWHVAVRDVSPGKVNAPLTVERVIPAEAKKRFDQAMVEYEAERYPQAIAGFTAAIAAYPQYAEAFQYRGQTYNWTDDTEAALRDLAEAIRLDGNGPVGSRARLARARLLTIEERTGEALDDFNALITADPQNGQALLERGRLHQDRAELSEALDDFDAAIKLDPTSLVYLMARGDALFETKDYPAALADYTAAIANYPKFGRAYSQRAEVHRKMGHTDLAAADDKKVAELKK